MVSRILEQEEAIRLVLSTDRKTSHLVPTWQDIDVLQSIHQALSPLSNLTDILSGEEYVTVSAVIPLMDLINNNFVKETEQDTQLTKDIKTRIKADLDTRYTEDVSDILKVATFLDPRFKTKYMTEIETATIKDKLEEECSTVELECESATVQSEHQPPEPPAKKRNLGTLFKSNEEAEETTVQTISREQHFSVELNSYVSVPKLDFEEDPLAWWKVQASSYPILAQLAQKYLCVCATSSPSERLFSASGNIVSPLRATLNPDKVNMLTFLAKNL